MFLTNSVLVYLCSPDTGHVSERLQRPQFGMHSIRWPDEEGTEYNLGHGDWIALLRRHGFEIEALIEPPVAPGAQTHEYHDFVSADWARRWPAEEDLGGATARSNVAPWGRATVVGGAQRRCQDGRLPTDQG